MRPKRLPGCYYGRDIPARGAVNCRVCGFCRGWAVSGLSRYTDPSPDARVTAWWLK